MGTRTEVTYIDDIDGSADNVRTVRIAVDGQQVEVDLSSSNVDKLTALLEPYLNAGRKVSDSSRRRRAPSSTSSAKGSDNQAIRDWAQANGYQVSTRGRIKKEIVDAYEAK